MDGRELLDKVDYQQSIDTLIHVGDIVAKGPRSMEVLARMAYQNVTGVRGNHDQKVIEWRGFIDWVKTQDGGSRWFDDLVTRKLSPKQFQRLSKAERRFPVPEDWEWGGEHWDIARQVQTLDLIIVSLTRLCHQPHVSA